MKDRRRHWRARQARHVYKKRTRQRTRALVEGDARRRVAKRYPRRHTLHHYGMVHFVRGYSTGYSAGEAAGIRQGIVTGLQRAKADPSILDRIVPLPGAFRVPRWGEPPPMPPRPHIPGAAISPRRKPAAQRIYEDPRLLSLIVRTFREIHDIEGDGPNTEIGTVGREIGVSRQTIWRCMKAHDPPLDWLDIYFLAMADRGTQGNTSTG